MAGARWGSKMFAAIPQVPPFRNGIVSIKTRMLFAPSQDTRGGSGKVNTGFDSDAAGLEFKERVRSNQARLTAGLKAQYDFIVCGAGRTPTSTTSFGRQR
jgi:hypothetical protein